MDNTAPDDTGNGASQPSQYGMVPMELRQRSQWVGFKLVPKADKPGKFDKVPFNPRNGNKASTTDPDTWGSFDEAVYAVTRYRFDGIGYVFAEDDPYAGADFDGCRDATTGDIAQWGQELLALLDGGYAEASPSATGVHVLGRGKVPSAGHKTPYKEGVVELYDHARFFTVTGNALPTNDLALPLVDITDGLQKVHDLCWADKRYNQDSGPQPDTNGKYAPPTYGATGLTDDDLLDRCRTDKTGEQFIAFYDYANLFDVDWDDSVADWFVWSKLVFYLGDDVERIIKLAEQGEHYKHTGNDVKARERQNKWQRPEPTYGTLQRQTIAKALAGHTRAQIFQGGASISIQQDLHVVVDKTMDVLQRANDPRRGMPALYVRAGLISRVHTTEKDRPVIMEINESGLKVEIDRVVRYTKLDAKGHRVRTRPPWS